MITVTYLGESFECTTAIKGDDYIHLLDDNCVMITSFDGVSDFSGFSISGGSWTSPTEENDCYVAVIRDDGTIGKGSHTCRDIGEHTHYTYGTEDIVAGETALETGKMYLVYE